MADNYPLKVNNVSRRIEEYNVGDNVNLTGNNIIADSSLGAAEQYLKSDGTKVVWDNPGDVYLVGAQTLDSKTLTNTTLVGASNPGVVLENSNLVNSTITINGTPVPLGGSVASADSNTTYVYTAADGIGSTKLLRLTSAGTNAGVIQDIGLVPGSNVTITRATNTLTISATDTNTTYSAGNGLSLSGTTFFLKNNAALTAERLLKWDDTGKQVASSLIGENQVTSLVTVNGNLTVTTTTETQNLRINSSSFSLRNGISLNDDTTIRMQFNRSTDTGGAAVNTAALEWYGTGQYFRLNQTGNAAGTIAANRREIVTTSDTQTLLSKTFVTPELGSASATSINNLTITDPGTSATLSLGDNTTFETNQNIFFDATGGTTSLTVNGSLAFELVSDTTLRIRARGSDGTTRSVDLTLA